MNTVVATIGDYEIRKYGSCGTFFFLVAESKSKKVLLRSRTTLEESKEFVCNMKNNLCVIEK